MGGTLQRLLYHCPSYHERSALGILGIKLPSSIKAFGAIVPIFCRNQIFLVSVKIRGESNIFPSNIETGRRFITCIGLNKKENLTLLKSILWNAKYSSVFCESPGQRSEDWWPTASGPAVVISRSDHKTGRLVTCVKWGRSRPTSCEEGSDLTDTVANLVRYITHSNFLPYLR